MEMQHMPTEQDGRRLFQEATNSRTGKALQDALTGRLLRHGDAAHANLSKTQDDLSMKQQTLGEKKRCQQCIKSGVK